MNARKVKPIIAFAVALVLVPEAIPHDVAASSTSTIYSFRTMDPDGTDPKGR
jgi:hypothetical protein